MNGVKHGMIDDDFVVSKMDERIGTDVKRFKEQKPQAYAPSKDLDKTLKGEQNDLFF